MPQIDQNTLLILIATGVALLLLGWLLGWLLTKSRNSSKVAMLQAAADTQAAQAAQLLAVQDEIKQQLDTVRLQSTESSNEKIRLQSGLEELQKRLKDLLEEREELKQLIESLSHDRNDAKELAAALRSRSDEAQRQAIEQRNDYLRLKGQSEEWNRERERLNNEIATLKATYTQHAKGCLEIADDREKQQQEVRRQAEIIARLTGENNSLQAKYEEAVKAVTEQKEFVQAANAALKDAFANLSSEALKANNNSFLELAKTQLDTHVTEAKGELELRRQSIESMVKPLSESLKNMDEKINTIEKQREGAYEKVHSYLDMMRLTAESLKKETHSLVSALKTSHSRGRYGEIALRRLVEFAGMMEHCDFDEQVSTAGENGKLRPDMIVRLPGQRSMVIDSKVPLAAYLQIFETEDHTQQQTHLGNHIGAVKTHIRQLSDKAYWNQFADAPDFVVLFMQIESSYSAALQAYPGLIEEALNNKIIIATPTTLITILRSVGYSWNQLKTFNHIESIREAAVELYERSATLAEHFSNVGKSLNSTVNNYNKAIGSFEQNFMPQARRIGTNSEAYIKKQMPDLPPVEVGVRSVSVVFPKEMKRVVDGE
jgi:DNA recombination protein RmuC